MNPLIIFIAAVVFATWAGYVIYAAVEVWVKLIALCLGAGRKG